MGMKTSHCKMAARSYAHLWMQIRPFILSREMSLDTKALGAMCTYRNHSLNIRKTFCTSKDAEEEVEMYVGPPPKEKLDIRFVRGSGPGGQNVNKLNTKAEMRFHLDSADWIPDRVKLKTKEMFKNKLNKAGEVVLTSHKHRTQFSNVKEVLEKLDTMLKEASEIKRGPSHLTLARIKAIKKKAEKQRRADKKRNSLKKQERKLEFDDRIE